MIFVTENISLFEDALQFSAVKASGPGGQHVNTTNSAVQLKFDARRCEALSDAVFNRLKGIAGSRMTNDGMIVLHCSDNRSQFRNKTIVTERLLEMIRAATHVPKRRIKTKPSKGAKQRRLDGKARTSSLKKSRGRVRSTD